MSDVTQLLSALEQGDPHAAAQLLPLVYDELRKLAAQRMARDQPGQALQATALVHEACLPLTYHIPGRRLFMDGAERPVFEDADGRQPVINDGLRTVGGWLGPAPAGF